jgi:hypothetical protein
VFLTGTTLTSVTGFFFPIERFTPALAVGILSLLALSVAVVARYPMQMSLCGFPATSASRSSDPPREPRWSGSSSSSSRAAATTTGSAIRPSIPAGTRRRSS